jgi:hypothetical protein
VKLIIAVTLAAAAAGVVSAQLPEPSSRVAVTGCLQHTPHDIASGVKSPSGWALVGGSASPAGGETPGGAGQRSRASTQPPADAGERTSGKSNAAAQRNPGLTYILEGSVDFEKHAGERVEIRGTAVKSGSSTGPQRIRVDTVKTIASTCSPR